MGGQSHECPKCQKWFLQRGAMHDRIKAKHREPIMTDPHHHTNDATYTNLITTQPKLKQYSREQVMKAFEFWSLSGDYPEEDKIIRYIAKD